MDALAWWRVTLADGKIGALVIVTSALFEICDFAQRLTVARFLDAGEPYVEVQARTGASSTTVSRVSKALNGESGGYRRVLIELDDAK